MKKTTKQISFIKCFNKILGYDKKQYWIVFIFASQSGILSLSVPIAIQSFVNSVSFIGTLSPILILSFILFVVLGLSVVLQLLQFITVEKLERRFFGLNFVDFIEKIPYLNHSETKPKSHLGMLYWELLAIQKNMKSIFIDVLAIFLQLFSGIFLISFYHPWFLVFSLLLAIIIYVTVVVPRRKSFVKAYDFSLEKYNLAYFVQDICKNYNMFFSEKSRNYLENKTNNYLDDYLTKRKKYFNYVIFQNIGMMLVYILGTSGLLGLGGYMVIINELALGQLVACEIIISSLLYNLWKLGGKIESIDAFFVGLYKMDHLNDYLEYDNDNAVLTQEQVYNQDLKLAQIICPYNCFNGKALNLTINHGSKILIQGIAGSGKSVLSKIICGQLLPLEGKVEIGGYDIKLFTTELINNNFLRLRKEEIIQDSIMNNISCLNPDIGSRQIKEVLDKLKVFDSTNANPIGIESIISPEIHTLSGQNRILLMVARAMLSNVPVLIFDEILDFLDAEKIQLTLDALFTLPHKPTIIVTTGRKDLANGFDQIISA